MKSESLSQSCLTLYVVLKMFSSHFRKPKRKEENYFNNRFSLIQDVIYGINTN